MRKFQGTLRKIQLISNKFSFWRRPDPKDENEQRLTITAGGRVWLSRYRFDGEPIERTSFSISRGSAEKIINTVGDFFKNYCFEQCFLI